MLLFRRAKAGFTIIEILVALTLVAAVILLVTRAFLTVLSVTSQGGRVTVASALAAKKVEEIRTRVEGKLTRDTWRTAYCNNVVPESLTAFPAPYGAYSYRVLTNSSAVTARPGQEGLLLPCSVIDWADLPRCPGPAYAPNCAGDGSLGQDDRLRWVMVEVFFRGGAQPVARMTTAVIRGAYHR